MSIDMPSHDTFSQPPDLAPVGFWQRLRGPLLYFLSLFCLHAGFLYAWGCFIAPAILTKDRLQPLLLAYPIALLASAIAGFCRMRVLQHDAAHLRAQRIQSLEDEQLRLRSLGDASENRVAATVLSLAQQLDENAHAESGMVMRYPAAAAGQMSRFEVDNLLVTRFGVFLVEVKNWKHPVHIGPSGWMVDKPDDRSPVTSPLEQSAPKYRVLRQLADQAAGGEGAIPVESIVVFSHPKASFSVQAPRQVLYMTDLPYYLRLAYLRAAKAGLPSPEAVARMRQSIAALHDTDPMAKHHFLLELASRNISAFDYQALEQERQRLLSLPPVAAGPFWRSWLAYVPIALFFVAEALFLTSAAVGASPLAALPSASATASASADVGKQKPPKHKRKKQARHAVDAPNVE